MRSERLPAMLVLVAALLTGAGNASARDTAWVSLCSASGSELWLLVGKDGMPSQDHGASGACHAPCTLPRKALRERRAG